MACRWSEGKRGEEVAVYKVPNWAVATIAEAAQNSDRLAQSGSA